MGSFAAASDGPDGDRFSLSGGAFNFRSSAMLAHRAREMGFVPPSDADGFWYHAKTGPIHDDDLDEVMIAQFNPLIVPNPLKPLNPDT